MLPRANQNITVCSQATELEERRRIYDDDRDNGWLVLRLAYLELYGDQAKDLGHIR